MISKGGKTLKFSEKFLMLKDILFYLLCLVLNRPVTILGKNFVLDPEGLRSQAEEGARFGYTGIVSSNKQYY